MRTRESRGRIHEKEGIYIGDLIVKPSYVFGERDILTADKLNLLATPVVELSLQDPVNDQNFFRNGNFYSSFWTTPTGVTCPVNVWTTNASYWLCRPQGASVASARSSAVPDVYSLFSNGIVGNTGVTSMEFGQQINGDLSATLRRNVTFSGYFFPDTQQVVSPVLNFYTANAFNNFSTLTLRKTVNLQSAPAALWTYMTATVDLTSMTNVTNGLLVAVQTTGVLTASTKAVYFSRLKLQIGEVATEFVDDTSLFVQAPSVDSTMLQDGCIARPGLFLPNVIPKGAYQAKSIYNGDISDSAIDGRTMLKDASTTLSAGFTQPAVSGTVSIAVVSTTNFAAIQVISIAGGGAYVISSVTDATHMAVVNPPGVSGNVTPGTSVPTGGAVHQASAVAENLGYFPIAKSGDANIGPGALNFSNEVVVGSGAWSNAAIIVTGSAANSANDGYMPALSFNRTNRFARAVGLDINGRFKTVDSSNTVGYLLDSVTKVDTNSYQDGSITYQKLAQALINLICPVATVVMFAGASPPNGWFVCDGTAVSRTTYSALFAQLGTYWGTGDGVNTFNVPDFRGRAPLGYCNTAGSGMTARVFGSKGGEETHTLSVAELPSHNHPDSGHQHTYSAFNYFTGGPQVAAGATQTNTQTQNTGVGFANNQAAGGNGAHNTMMPFGVIYFIIKAIP